MSSPSSFAAEAQKILAEIKTHEAQARTITLTIEGKQRTLLERGRKHYAEVLGGHRQQAVASLERAGKALAALGPAPSLPSPVADPVAFADSCETHDSAVAEHTAKVSAVLLRCARECQALHHAASDAKREARNMGFEAPDGVAFVPEHVRRHARYSARVDRWLGFAGRGEYEVLSVADVALLVEALRLERPEPQAPSPDHPYGVPRKPELNFTQGWARVREALADDPPAKVVQTQTERDADRVMQRSPEEQHVIAERQTGIRP
jgi:hypothetical protein